MPGTEITIARMADGEQAGEFLFTSESVARAREFYDLVRDRPVQQGPDNVIETWRAAPGLAMPDVLAARIWELPRWALSSIWGQPVWKWLAVAFGGLAAACAAWLAWWLGRKLDWRCAKAGVDWRVGQPVALLCAVAAVIALQGFVEQAVLFRERPGVAAAVAITTIRYILLAWLVAVLIVGIGNVVTRGFASGKASLDAALILLCFRILSIIGALFVILHAASEVGLSVTPIIAELGVGGLAVALAIRPTLENIVGGFVLFGDRPVRVGEFCSFGDKIGTVEEIGLRSTRIRGLDRTMITVPNADFAQLQIVNYTRRDMNLFQSSIGLRYESTPDQLRYVAVKIRKLLIQHSKVLPNPARVRLSAFGDFGLRAGGLRLRPLRRLGGVSRRQGGSEPADRRNRSQSPGPASRSRRARSISAAIPGWTAGAPRRPRPRSVGGAMRSGCHFRSSISPSAPRWPTPCCSRRKARPTSRRAGSHDQREHIVGPSGCDHGTSNEAHICEGHQAAARMTSRKTWTYAAMVLEPLRPRTLQL